MLALGVAAEGPWNEVGGKAKAIIPALEFANIFSFQAARAWTLQQNVIRRARLDIDRRKLVLHEDEGLYEGKDRLQVDVSWETYKGRVVFFNIYVFVARAALIHRTKHASDARLTKHLTRRGDALVIDYQMIRKERWIKISQGMAQSAKNFPRGVNRFKKKIVAAADDYMSGVFAVFDGSVEEFSCETESDTLGENVVTQEEYVHPVDEGDDTPLFCGKAGDAWHRYVGYDADTFGPES